MNEKCAVKNLAKIVAERSQTFGGSWTELKLDVVAAYLDSYTTALKHQGFAKMYVDAFAGTGYREMMAEEIDTPVLLKEAEAEAARIFDGSAELSLKITNPFDRYVFVEKSLKRMKELRSLRTEHADLASRMEFSSGDANQAIPELCKKVDWHKFRAVLFLDPYGMTVDWSTMEAIARTRAIDVWILFPVGIGVNRLLKHQRDQIPSAWCAKLDRVFGTSAWEQAFFETDRQGVLFEGEESGVVKVSDPIQAISRFYRTRLKTIFPKVAPNPRYLCNAKNNPMFLLTFAMASESKKAQDLGMKFARYILEKRG